MNKKILHIIFILCLLLFPVIEIDAQCAMCKAAAESTLENNPRSLARGLNKGILFLMGIPYIAVGLIFRKEIIIFFKNIKNKSKEPLSRDRKQWLTFSLSFATVMVLLFIIFLKVNYQ
jgi:hypothetical protein